MGVLVAVLAEVFPSLIKMLADVVASWSAGKVSLEQAMEQMHAAVDAAGASLSKLDQDLASQHADFETKIHAHDPPAQ